jgi:hypothetical protein
MASAPNTSLECLGPVRGRPSLYTFELSEEICGRIAAGELLQDICKDDDMPAERTVTRWVLDDLDGFFGRYARAREVQVHGESDQVRSIADDPDIEPEHKRIMVDARKWRAERLNRRTYGNSVQHKHDVEVRPAAGAAELPPGIAWIESKLSGSEEGPEPDPGGMGEG